MVVQQPIVHTDVMLGANDDRPGPRGSAPTPRAGTEIGDGRLTLVSTLPRVHGEVPPPRETARAGLRRRRSRSRLSNATLIGLACVGSIGAVGAVNASLFPSLGHPTSESVWQNPGKVPTSTAGDTTPSARAERVVVVDPTFALVVGVVPAGGAAGAVIESTSTEPAPLSTLDAIGAAQPAAPRPAAASGSSGSGSGSGSGSVQGITTSTVPTNSSPTVDSPDHVTPSTPSTPVTTDDHGVDGPDTTADTTADTTPSATVDSTPSDTTDPASGGTPSGSGGKGSSGSGKGGSGG